MSIRTKLMPLGGEKKVKKYTLTVNCSYGSTYIYILDANGNQLASTYNTETLSYSAEQGTVLKYYVHSTNSPYFSNTYSVTMNANHTATFTVSHYSTTTYSYELDSDLQKVGTPYVTTEGLISNFSSSNYFTTKNDAASYMSQTNYEIQLRFIVSALSSRSFLFSNRWASNPTGANIEILTSNKLRFTAGYSGATLALNWSTTNTITTNTWYTVNLKNNNNTYTVDAGSLGTHSITTRKTTWSTVNGLNYGRLFGDAALPAQYAIIDLKNSWVKSDGSYVINNEKATSVIHYEWVHSVT